MKKKLIEVAVPLDAINKASGSEKSIHHGHPSTLHLWWARRPLAACRAVLFAQLVDDPSAHPDRFPTEEAQNAERERLFDILRELVKWENSNNEEVLNAARAEIMRSCDGSPPPVLDPFAGGGSIPLEAQRLGLKAHASDLNPVAVLINKALIEIPPKFADQPPVHPEAEVRTRWQGAEGLAEDVRCYGQWIRDEAERRIGHLYPKAILPNGEEATVIAWVWARTVECPNPACRAVMPLVKSFWLSKKKGRKVWARPVVGRRSVRFEIDHDQDGSEISGTVGRRGAICLCCREPVQLAHIRKEGQTGRMGQQLMAIVAQGVRKRIYLTPNNKHEETAETTIPEYVPCGKLTGKAKINVSLYGMEEWSDLFADRQMKALTTFSDLINEVYDHIIQQHLAINYCQDKAKSYASAVATYLSFAVDRLTMASNLLCRWNPVAQKAQHAFGRQALPMVWDFADTNPMGSSTGSLHTSFMIIANVLERSIPQYASCGTATQGDARVIDKQAILATDPPYYDNICYADLSDFFYVWLRRTLRDIYPELFSTIATPKSDELIASPNRHGRSKAAAAEYFEEGFIEVFTRAKTVSTFEFPMTLFYAFKQSEKSVEGVASTGWSTMLEGLIAAGWTVTGTWPMRTEMGSRMIGQGSNALASSIVLACRPRPDDATITDRRGFLRALHSDMPVPIRKMQKSAIAPVDLRQAAIGPGMEVFSRYSRVVESDGSPMRVHTALGMINRVLETVLGEAETDLDPETRWAVTWYSQHFEDEGPYGTAEQLAVAMNVSVDGLARSGILRTGSGKARLLSRDEMPTDWDPDTDERIPVWEAVQHLTRSLLRDGYSGAGRLLTQLSGKVKIDACRALAYRLYTICETSRPNLAGPYNALAVAWPEIQINAAQATKPPPPTYDQTTLNT